MTNIEIQEKAKEYREYKRMIEELEAMRDSIADELKQVMEEAGETKMIVGEYKLSYSECTRHDIDRKRLEAEQEAIYKAYMREVSYKRFLVS